VTNAIGPMHAIHGVDLWVCTLAISCQNGFKRGHPLGAFFFYIPVHMPFMFGFPHFAFVLLFLREHNPVQVPSGSVDQLRQGNGERGAIP
jgi:hypothetical protein